MAAAETIGNTIAKAKNVTTHCATAAPRAQHPDRFDSLAADHRRDLPADLFLFRAGGPRGYGGRRRRRRFSAGADSRQYDVARLLGRPRRGGFGGSDSGEAASAALAAAISAAAAHRAIGKDPMDKLLTQLVGKLQKAYGERLGLGGALRLGRRPATIRPNSPTINILCVLSEISHPRTRRRRGDLPLVARAGQPVAAAADRAANWSPPPIASRSSSTISSASTGCCTART